MTFLGHFKKGIACSMIAWGLFVIFGGTLQAEAPPHWDEGIHWGCIICKFCFTADILRYTEGQTEESRWTDEDTADMKRIIEMTRGFFDRTWLWMYQHTIASRLCCPV